MPNRHYISSASGDDSELLQPDPEDVLPVVAAPPPKVANTNAAIAASKLNELPRDQFVLITAFVSLLSFNGGFINGLSIAGFYGMGLTHLTGVTTLAATSLVHDPHRAAPHPWWYYWLLVMMFCSGAVVCGIIVGDKRTRFKGRQCAVLTIEAVFLWIAYFLNAQEMPQYAPYFIAFACGIQNASTSTLSIAVIRTTNVTGTVVDIGLALGQCVRYGFAQYRWKLCLWTACYLSFWFGAYLGATGIKYHGLHIMAVPVSLATVFASLIGFRTFMLNHYHDRVKDMLFFKTLG